MNSSDTLEKLSQRYGRKGVFVKKPINQMNKIDF